MCSSDLKRVNLSAVNRKAIESMVLSGGFDSFGIARERYMSANNKGEVFLDTLMRFGQHFQAEKMQAQMSLFGSDMVEIATPPIPEGDPWSNIERLNRERDLVGIYLSAHPLDEYSMILKHMCNTTCPELGDKEELAKKDTITFGGVVTAVKSKFSRNGTPCGFVTVEDFCGSGEIALFGEEWAKWRGMLTEACTVFVSAKAVQKFRDSKIYDLRISDIQYLQTVKKNAIKQITVTINADNIDKAVVRDFAAAVDDNPGQTPLFLQVFNAKGKVLMKSKAKTVELRHQLIQFIEQTEGMNYFIN